MNELRELLFKDDPSTDEVWDGNPQHLTVTLLDGVEHTAHRLARDSKDDLLQCNVPQLLKLNATQLLKEIRKYREAVTECRWNDAERLLERVDSFHKDLLELYLDELNEHAISKHGNLRGGGRKSKRTKNAGILEVIRQELERNKRSTNRDLWFSFVNFCEDGGEEGIVHTDQSSFEVSMNEFDLMRDYEKTLLHCMELDEYGRPVGKIVEIKWSTFNQEYVPDVRKKLKEKTP